MAISSRLFRRCRFRGRGTVPKILAPSAISPSSGGRKIDVAVDNGGRLIVQCGWNVISDFSVPRPGEEARGFTEAARYPVVLVPIRLVSSAALGVPMLIVRWRSGVRRGMVMATPRRLDSPSRVILVAGLVAPEVADFFPGATGRRRRSSSSSSSAQG